MRWALTALFVVTAPWEAASGELRVASDFEGGSGYVQGIDQQERVIRLVPTPYEDRGWVCWWYVKITGIEPGETLTLDVGEGTWATPDRAAWSTDRETWRQTGPGQRVGERIIYRQSVDAKETWFAWGPPYVPSDARDAVAQAAKAGPFAEAFVLCRTHEERPVPALVVSEAGGEAEPDSGVWIQARQHAWESGSSWVCQGFIDWLVSDEPRAAVLRQRAEVTVVPIMDVDNVARGAGGKNQVPNDHNRDWDDDPHWPSVAAAMKRIRQTSEAGRFDLFVDLHNPGASARAPFFFVAPKELLSERQQGNQDLFLAACKAEITGPLAFTGRTRTSGANYDRRWQAISKNWVSRNTSAVAVTLETAWNTPHSTPEGYRQVGRELGRAIERYLRHGTREAAE